MLHKFASSVFACCSNFQFHQKNFDSFCRFPILYGGHFFAKYIAFSFFIPSIQLFQPLLPDLCKNIANLWI